jgi:hypothetical protein
MLQPALPKGLDAVQAGRIGLWLLSRRSHKAALQRVVFPQRDWHASFVLRFVRLLAQWKICEYPGTGHYLATVLGISHSYARNLLKPSWKLPGKHALKMADYLVNHASQCDALAHELRAYAAAENIRKFANGKLATRR